MGTAGLAVVKGNVVFDINAEDSHDRMYIVRMVAEVNGDAEHNVKCEACGRKGSHTKHDAPLLTAANWGLQLRAGL